MIENKFIFIIKLFLIINIIFINFINSSISSIYINDDNSNNNNNNTIYKIATILPGFINDFADSYLFFQGVENVVKEIKNIESIVQENQNLNNINKTIVNLINIENVNLIIFSNYIFYEYSYNLSKQYQNITILVVNDDPNSLIKSNLINQNNTNFIEVYYPTTYTSFLAGYVSGLATKTNKIGYLAKGEKYGDQSLLNMYYFGAKLSNPNIKVSYVTLGNNTNQDIVSNSIHFLINSKNIDSICGTSQYERMIEQYMINNNITIISSSNGLPFLNNNNSNNDNPILFNIIKNWSINLKPIISNLINYNNFIINNNNNNTDINNSTDSENNSYNNNTIILPPITSSFIFNFSFFQFQYSSLVSNIIENDLNGNLTIFEMDFNLPYLNKYNIKLNNNKNINQIENNNIIINDCNSLMKFNGECIQNIQFESLKYNDLENLGNYEGFYYKIPESKPVRLSFIIISGILIGFLIFIQICIYKLKNKPSFKSASPTFLVFITIGGIMGYIGIIVWVSGINDFSCNFKFWSVSLGFSMMIGAIVVKNFRIWLIFDNPKLRAIKITNFQLLPWVLGMILINVFFLCLISFLGDVKQTVEFVEPFSYKTKCTMNEKGMDALFVLLGYFCIILLFGVFVSWKIRIVDIEEFNESKTIAHTLYSISFCLLIIIPFLVSQQSNIKVNLILCIAIVFLITAIILNMFIPKFYGLFIYGAEGSNEIFRNRNRNRKKSNINNTNTINNNNLNNKNQNKRVNLYLYDFTDDSDQSNHSAKEMEEFNEQEEYTQPPNSEVGNEITNDDPTYTTEASEQPNPTPRTNISNTPRTNDILTPRTFTNTPRTDISTPRTNDVLTPRTNLALNTPRTDISSNGLTPRSESDVMTPRQYHNHILSLSPIIEEENNNNNNSQLNINDENDENHLVEENISQYLEINIEEIKK